LGLVGYRRRAFHWARALGIALLVAGVVLIAKFDGSSSSSSDAAASGVDMGVGVQGGARDGPSGSMVVTSNPSAAMVASSPGGRRLAGSDVVADAASQPSFAASVVSAKDVELAAGLSGVGCHLPAEGGADRERWHWLSPTR
jgi:hypothetical protein